MKTNKRGQAGFESILALVLLLVTAGLLVTIGAYVVQEVEDQVAVSTVESDDKITLVNGTAVELTRDDIISISSNYNATNSSTTLTEDTDFTLQKYAGTVTLLSADYAGDWNFTYTYYAPTGASEAANATVESLGDVADWFTIIVVVVIAVIIIGLVVTAFAQKRR